MKDPTPLVDYVYEMYIDHYLRRVRIGGSYPTRDDYLFQSLYHESSITLPGSPLHNHHINVYDPLVDGLLTRPFDITNKTESENYQAERLTKFAQYNFNPHIMPIEKIFVRIPSKLYVFRNLMQEVVYDIKHRKNDTKVQECIMEILRPNPEVAKRLLSTCRKISRYQPVTDLLIDGAHCVTSKAPIMSIKTRALSISMSNLPVTFVRNIFQQLVESHCVTLQNFNSLSMNLSDVEVELNKILDQIVSHHKRTPHEQFLIVHYDRDAPETVRKLRLNLIQNNLSRDFRDRWTMICKRITSIECYIKLQDNESDVISFDNRLGTLNLNMTKNLRLNLLWLFNKFSDQL